MLQYQVTLSMAEFAASRHTGAEALRQWRWHALPLLIDTHGSIVPVDSVKAIASVYLIQDWLEITAPDKDRNCHIASSIGVDVRLGII